MRRRRLLIRSGFVEHSVGFLVLVGLASTTVSCGGSDLDDEMKVLTTLCRL